MNLSKIKQLLILFIAISFRLTALFYSSTILNYLLLFLLLFLVISDIFKKKYSIEKLRKIIILLILSSIIFLIYNEDNLFIYLITSLAFIDIEDDKVIKYFTIIAIICFLSIIIAGQAGIIKTVVSGRYINNETIYRNSLGFGNVNSAFIYYLGIVFGLYYIFRKSRIKLFAIYILTTLVAIWIFKETDCRTGFYTYILFIIISLIYNNKINNFIKPFIPYLFIIFTILSFLIAIYFGKTIDNPINLLLSYRPYFSNYYIKNNLWLSIFGTGVVDYYVLDNYYLSLLVKTGLLGYLTYSYIFMKGSKLISNNYKYVLIMLFVLIYGISETNLYGNFLLIILLKVIIVGDDKEVFNE